MTLEDTELLETEEEPVAYYRGLNNYLYYLFFFGGGGFFIIISSTGPQNPILIVKAPILDTKH